MGSFLELVACSSVDLYCIILYRQVVAIEPAPIAIDGVNKVIKTSFHSMLTLLGVVLPLKLDPISVLI